MKRFCCCFNNKSLNKINDLKIKGRKKLNEDSNIVSLLKTIQKLKAAVSVLVDQNTSITSQIEQTYIQNQTLYYDNNEL